MLRGGDAIPKPHPQQTVDRTKRKNQQSETEDGTEIRCGNSSGRL